MTHFARAYEVIRAKPESTEANHYRDFIDALERGASLPLDALYALSHEEFESCVGMLKEWRLRRFCHQTLSLFE